MAITSLDVQKVAVERRETNDENSDSYQVTIRLICYDGSDEVINEEFNIVYRTGDAIPDIEVKGKAAMQRRIDRYNAEQVIYTHPQFDNVITNIENDLVI